MGAARPLRTTSIAVRLEVYELLIESGKGRFADLFLGLRGELNDFLLDEILDIVPWRLLLCHNSFFNTEANRLMVLIFSQSQLQRIITDVSETAPGRLIKAVCNGIVHHFLPLCCYFLLHSLRTNLNIQILLEATTHRLERADLL